MARKFHSRLNIFIDETGEFGFSGKSAKYYGISFVIHEQDSDISSDIKKLEKKFSELGFYETFHMGDLLYRHKDFKEMSIEKRKKIYFQMYKFVKNVDIKIHTSIFEKRYSTNPAVLQKKILMTLEDFISRDIEYLQSFDKIKIYYDSGQSKLASEIDKAFGKLSNYEREHDFDHHEKKLFQAADLIAFLDKLIFKYDNKIELSKAEEVFFTKKIIREEKKALRNKRLQKVSKIRKAPFRVL